MENLYKPVILMKTFQDHYEKQIKDYEERKNKYPDTLEKPPNEQEFHITLALKSICFEICELNHLIGKLQQEFDEYKDEHS